MRGYDYADEWGDIVKKTYKVTFEKKQSGVLLDTYELTCTCDSICKPKVGQGHRNLVDPPIEHTIIKVEEITDENP
jgi:hypothetical protein